MTSTAIAPAAGAAASAPAAAETEPRFDLSTSRQFTTWLAETGCSLALSTYQSGKVILLGSNTETGRLSIFDRTLERPMGMAADDRRLAIASLYQIYTFVDARTPGQRIEGGYDAVYVPQLSHFTGDLDVHDMAWGTDGLVFVNTLFGCLATVSETHSFRPLWKPGFLTRLAAEDRCHLNGLAMNNGKPAFVTAVSATDVADSWREHRMNGGVAIDVASSEIVCRGLSMPHSPRWHDGKLWLLNSGTGELGRVDMDGGRFEPVTFCPGYLRGLTFIGRYAVVGLSEPRENQTFAGLALQARLEREKVEARCGVMVIDTQSGDIVHWARIRGVVSELYDVIALPHRLRPSMIGFRSHEIRRVISVEG